MAKVRTKAKAWKVYARRARADGECTGGLDTWVSLTHAPTLCPLPLNPVPIARPLRSNVWSSNSLPSVRMIQARQEEEKCSQERSQEQNCGSSRLNSPILCPLGPP